MDHDSWQQVDDAEGERLARYVSGRSNPLEAAEIQDWMAADPMRVELVDSLRRVWEMAGRPQGDWDVTAAWQEFRARQQARRRTRVQPLRKPARPPQRVSPWYLRAAAVLALAVGGAAFWGTAVRQSSEEAEPVAMREYQTQRGERAELRLSDGTRVVLSVDTRLRVPQTYGVTSREVHLEGEALFEVEHDEKRPFRVHASSVVAEDLGTVFGVRSYPDGRTVSIVVSEGIVGLKAPNGQFETVVSHRLNPGDLATVSANGTVGVRQVGDPMPYLAFAQGRLVFRDAPLVQVAADLGRWHDLEIRMADPSLGSRRVTASFQDEPVTRVLDLIALSLGLRYDRRDNVVTFRR